MREKKTKGTGNRKTILAGREKSRVSRGYGGGTAISLKEEKEEKRNVRHGNPKRRTSPAVGGLWKKKRIAISVSWWSIMEEKKKG